MRTAKGILGRLGATLFFGVFLVMGLFFFGVLLQDLGKTAATYRWKETPATIVKSAVEETKKGGGPFRVAVTFRYQWEGKTYTSDRYHTTDLTEDEYSAANRKIADLPLGTATHCYVNPEDPGQAVLRRKGLGSAVFLLVPLVFILVGGGGIVGSWVNFSGRPRPVTAAASSGGHRWGTWLFGGVFAGVGAAVLVFWFLPMLVRSLDSLNWTETPCTVISSQVKSHRGKNGTTYSVEIFYRYQFEGREFKSNSYRTFRSSSSGREAKAKVVAKYPPGAKSVCYVNPKNPAEAVLVPGVGWGALLGLLPLIFLTVGIFIIWAGWKKPSSESPDASLGSPGTVSAADMEPRVLEPRSPPHLRFGGTLIFALFWNGIVSVFLWQVVDGFRKGSPDWFLTLFLIPFVAVGLGAVGGTVYAALALFNPRCRLRLTPGVMRPGGTYEVGWTLTGASSRVRHLQIVLEGREEATYRRGTSSCTDRHTFARIAVADVPGGLEVAQGEARFRVPDNVPPSFAAPNNRIVWTLNVRGEIPFRPDMQDEFEVTMKGAKL
jgi:Protein of unknown function (DUF3592).